MASASSVHKCLVLVRHATAESHSHPQLDFNRQLHPNGILEATYLAKRLAERIPPPDTIVSSLAPRALQTAIILAEYNQFPAPKIKSQQHLYNAPLTVLLDELARLPEEMRTVVLVAHNPGISEAVIHLSRHAAQLPPGAAVGLDVPCAWAELGAAACRYVWHDYPQ